MPYSRPTLQDIVNRIEGDIKTRIERPETFLRNSVFKILSRAFGGSVHLLYDFIEYTKDQLFISTADAENLEKHGAEYGIYRSYGAKTTGQANASGTNGITIPANTELQSATGNVYIVDTAVVIAGGIATLNLTAKEVGTDYNEAVGALLTFVSPISGVLIEATVIGTGLTGGVEEDTDEEYRIKILNRKRKSPHGGIASDYERWCLEYSATITRAWALTEYNGIGTIGLAFVRDNEANIFPTEAYRNSVRSYIVSHYDSTIGKYVGIPITAEPGFFVIGLTPYTVDFTIQIYPNTSAVQANITTALQQLFIQDSAPGGTLYISKMYEAISSASGESRSKIITPSADIAVSINQLHQIGNITFQDYV